MADVYRFIDTAADAGGDGTTDATSSGDGTHAYNTIFTFEAAEDGLASATDVYHVQVRGYQDYGTSFPDFSGWPAATNINMFAAADDRCNGRKDQGAGFAGSNTNWTLIQRDNQVTWDGFRIINNGTGVRTIRTHTAVGAAKANAVRNCFIGGTLYLTAADGGSYTIENTVINCGTSTYFADAPNLLVGQSFAWIITGGLFTGALLARDYHSAAVKNSIFTGNDAFYFQQNQDGLAITVDNTLFSESGVTSQTYITATDCVDGVDFTGYFTDAANDDYTLTATGAAALVGGLGTDDPDIPATYADGTARGSSSSYIGPFGYATDGGGDEGVLLSLFIHNMRQQGIL